MQASGKTELIKRIITERNEIISQPISKILYIYGISDPDYVNFSIKHPEVTFSSILDESMLEPQMLLILDDLHTQLGSSLKKLVTDIILRNVHHMKLSIIIVLHSLFPKDFLLQKMSTDYVAIMRFMCGGSAIASFANQISNTDSSFFKQCYKHATSKPYSYLFCDLSQHQNDKFRFRSGLFPSKEVVVYSL